MRIEKGNVWDYHSKGYWVVIPTNLGWKANGEAVMGAGLAKQAAKRFPNLAKEYGSVLQDAAKFEEEVIYEDHKTKLILFPTIPLNKEFPYLSWKSDASLELIERKLEQMSSYDSFEWRKIAFPWLGAGLGNLSRDDVRKVMEKYLDSKNHVVVEL